MSVTQISAILYFLILIREVNHMNTILVGISGLGVNWFLTLTTLKYFCLNHGDLKVFFNLKIIINVLVGSFRFI